MTTTSTVENLWAQRIERRSCALSLIQIVSNHHEPSHSGKSTEMIYQLTISNAASLISG